MHRVRDLIQHRPLPYMLHPEMNTLEAARFLRAHHIGGAPVVEGERLVGFCSERDLTYRVLAEQRDPAAVTVGEVMSRDVIWATPDSRVEECEAQMLQADVRHLPIVDQGRVVGCLSMRNLLQSELEDSTLEVRWLLEYIHGPHVPGIG